MNEIDVTEALNETDLIVNTTANQSIFQINDITDVQNILSFAQSKVSDLIISWNYIPEDIYFRLLLIVTSVLVLYQLFVSGSSKIGAGFKWVLMAVLVVVILIALGII